MPNGGEGAVFEVRLALGWTEQEGREGGNFPTNQMRGAIMRIAKENGWDAVNSAK